MSRHGCDAVVVGAGLAGLVGALRLARAGASVTLVAAGLGGLQLSQGTLDVLGYTPERVLHPWRAIDSFAAREPEHPYAHLGADAVRAATTFVTDAVGPALLAPATETNLQLPTAVGAIRPTAVAPPSMLAGDLRGGARLLVVGLRRLKDFPASLVAGNLARTPAPDGGRIEARHAWVDLEVRSGERDSSGLTHARAVDDPVFRARFARAIAVEVRPAETVLVPGVLGLDVTDAHADLQRQVGAPVAEVPLPPPGIPGLRLARALTRLVGQAGVRVVNGSKVVGSRHAGDRLTALVVGEAGRPVEYRAGAFVFAPGGFESGALQVDSHLRITEPALGLPLTADDASGLVSEDFWGSEQALFRVGVRTDAAQRVTDASGAVLYRNLYAAGGVLAGANRWREKSGEGIAAASALRAADTILEEAR